MSTYAFVLRNDSPNREGMVIGRFDAYFSEIDKNNVTVVRSEIPEYVRIEGAVFRSKFLGGNYSIFVAPKVLPDSPNAAPRAVAYEGVSENAFFWYKVWHDKSQKYAFIGLLLAITGALIDTSFAVGKVHVYVPLSYPVEIVLLTLALVLKGLGLWWVFKKGFRESR